MTKGNAELISEDYYKKEIQYEKEIQALKNTESAKEKVKLVNNEEYLIFQFPTTQNVDKIKIDLLRPNNDKGDLTFSEAGTKNVMIDKKKLEKGVYEASISYEIEGKAFLQKEKIKI